MIAGKTGGADAGALRSFLRAEDLLARVLLGAGAAALLALASVLIYQVAMRFVFERPSSWSEAVARSLMIWSVFLCMPYVVGRGEMMAFDLLRRLSRGRTGTIVHVVVGAAMVTVFLILTIHGITLTRRAATQSLAGLEFIGARVSWVYVAIPLGSGASVVASVAYILRAVTGVHPEPAPASEDVS